MAQSSFSSSKWQRANNAPEHISFSDISEDLKKRNNVALHKDSVDYTKIAKTLKLSFSTVAKTILRFNRIGLHGCHPRRKPLLKMMHRKAHKQFAEDKQTKDMDYWNHVMWSDETKINLFGSDGVKRVWRQPGEEYKDKCVLPTVKHGGVSVMVWAAWVLVALGSYSSLREPWMPTCTVTYWSGA